MRLKFEVFSAGADETGRLGEAIGRELTAGDIVALIGDLGAGKTTLTQGIARGLDVPEAYAVTSPTFTLVNEYPGRRVLYHVDLYRLSGAADLETLGYEEFFFSEGVTVIEWAEKIPEVLDENCMRIELHHMDEHRRHVEIVAPAERIKKLSMIWKGGKIIQWV
jgi:tRNA threonylcarbamoyladenosine biosynthesis protein TsaE